MSKGLSVRAYINLFWADPEQALKNLIQEVIGYYGSRRQVCLEVARRSKTRYPQNPLPLSSISFWVAWCAGEGRPAAQRIPTLHNGVRLFILAIEMRNDARKIRKDKAEADANDALS